MNVRAVLCLVAFLVGTVSASAGQIDWGGGELLVDHQPHRFGGLTSDSMGFESLFRWEYSTLVEESFAFRNLNFEDWQRTTVSAEVAYQLLSIPEPALAALLAFASSVFLKRGVV